MTAAEAYECDPDFRALILAWRELGRCPLGLADRCRELGLSEAAADCCEWAAAEPDRRPFFPAPPLGKPCGPYPCLPTGTERWYWCGIRWYRDHRDLRHCNEYPFDWVSDPKGETYPWRDSVEAAILWLIGGWVGRPGGVPLRGTLARPGCRERPRGR